MTKLYKYFIVVCADLLSGRKEVQYERLDEAIETLFDLLNCKTFGGVNEKKQGRMQTPCFFVFNII